MQITSVKIVACFFLIFIWQHAVAQETDSVIGTGSFQFQKNTYTYEKLASFFFYDDQGIVDTAYQTVQYVLYKNDKKLLTQTLRQLDGDCNSINLELGAVEVKDSLINFYSYYAWLGGCCGLPYGARLQTYRLNAKGQLYLAQSKIYLEKYDKRPDQMNAADRKKWITQTEKEYGATFVTGTTAIDLMKKVKSKLAMQIKAETSDWASSYLAEHYGFRK